MQECKHTYVVEGKKEKREREREKTKYIRPINACLLWYKTTTKCQGYDKGMDMSGVDR